MKSKCPRIKWNQACAEKANEPFKDIFKDRIEPMVKCPHCDGEKTLKRVVSREWEEENQEVITCWTCNGAGEISEIKAAIYKARGGPAPVPLKGYG